MDNSVSNNPMSALSIILKEVYYHSGKFSELTNGKSIQEHPFIHTAINL